MTYTLKLTILKSRMIVNVIAAVILGLSLTHLLHPEVPLYSPYGNYYWYFKVHSSGGAMDCLRCPGILDILIGNYIREVVAMVN